MKIISKGYAFCIRAVEILSLILFVILTLVSVLKISYVDENIGEQIILGNDSVIGNLMALLFVCILGTFSFGWIRKLGNKGDKAIRLLLVVTCVWGFVFSLFWFFVAKYAPNADQASVYTIAIQFSKGDYSAICPKDSYLSCYPHQLGLVAFYELILRAFHSESFRLLECVNIPMVPAIIYGGYQLIPFITHQYKQEIRIWYLLIMLGCFPLFFYTPFLYGEIISIACVLNGLWMMFIWLQDGKWGKAVLSTLLIVLSVILRKNSLIFIIACVIGLLLYSIYEKKYKNLIYLFILTLTAVLVQPGLKAVYEYKAQNTLSEGVPGSAFVAMGLQECEIWPGWYNTYNYNTYLEADYDSKAAAKVSKESIGESLVYFRAHPAYALDFFLRKLMGQWADGSYACLQSTITHFGERDEWVESMFLGTNRDRMFRVFEQYQFVIYLGVLLYLAGRIKNRGTKQKIMELVPMITILGGVLFHLAWEGNSRYAFPYFIWMIPYGAAGLVGACEFLSNHKKCATIFHSL